MAKKRGFLTLVLALVMAIGLTVPTWAEGGVTGDITGGNSTYKHTYHTKIDAHATIYANGNKITIDYETDDFIEGNLSDGDVQAKIAEYYAMVDKKLEELGLDRVKDCSSSNKRMVFDHFESSNIIDNDTTDEETPDVSQGVQNHVVNKKLDVHEYQVYNINEVYGATPRYYYYNSTIATTDTDAPQGSPKTFDPGVAVYAFSGLLSLGGLTAVAKKRGR